MADSGIGIIGASLAGLHAARTLRSDGYRGRMLVVGGEAHPPYDRPPLSKDMLTRESRREDLALPRPGPDDVEWRLGTRVTGLDADARRATFDDGTVERFGDGIVIATGARARPLPGATLSGVHVVRTLEDSEALAAELAAGPRRVAVLGAGFVGCEVASAARSLGLEVTVLEALPVPLQRVLGPEVGARLAAMHRAHGVELRTGVSLTEVRGDDAGRVRTLGLSDGTGLDVDVLVVAIGVEPCVEWLADSGLAIAGGVRCDPTGLAAPGIAAAGDVAVWPSTRLGALTQVEHWDNAVRQGAHAARRLLAGDEGGGMHYDPIPWFWSDQHGRKIQLVGSTRGYEEVEVAAHEPGSGRFLALYRRGGRLAAACGVGRAKQVVACRRLMAADASWDEAMRSMQHTMAA
jgi:NADPH-dependent 2,4-dienoyl-CoA reductase/sulfur reductase-like enzyme